VSNQTEMKSEAINRGDRVAWSYLHCFGVSRARITKKGVFLGLCRHTKKHWRKLGAVQMAHVVFDGNSRMSLIPLDDLTSTHKK
jgi:hypothetical protein